MDVTDGGSVMHPKETALLLRKKEAGGTPFMFLKG